MHCSLVSGGAGLQLRPVCLWRHPLPCPATSPQGSGRVPHCEALVRCCVVLAHCAIHVSEAHRPCGEYGCDLTCNHGGCQEVARVCPVGFLMTETAVGIRCTGERPGSSRGGEDRNLGLLLFQQEGAAAVL